MVQHLVGGALVAAWNTEQFLHVRGIEIRYAPVADFAFLFQRLERRDRLGQGIRAAPVQQIEIDPIGVQPFQTARAGRRNSGAGGIARIHLTDNENPVPPPLHHLGHHLFGAALGVHLGGVDQRHAEIETQTQRSHLARRLGLALAHVPGAQTQGGDGLAGGQRDGAHQDAACSATRITRKKLPPQSFSRAPRSYPRRASSSVMFAVSPASRQSLNQPPPSKSEEIPT